MKQPSKTISTSTIRKTAILAFLLSLMSMVLQGCGGFLYSTLSEADIHATAYDIATTRLATTIEVPPEAFYTAAPGVPTPTTDPTFCPPDSLEIWKAATLEDLTVLDQNISIVIGDVYTPEQLTQMAQQAQEWVNALPQEEIPRCAYTATRRLADVYEQFIVTINTRLAGDLAALPQEKLELQQAIQKMMDAIREIVPGEDFKPFDDLMSKYRTE